MKEKTRVYEVRKTFERKVEDKVERIIFEKVEDKWIYKAPNAQSHTIEQLEEILNQLKKLEE